MQAGLSHRRQQTDSFEGHRLAARIGTSHDQNVETNTQVHVDRYDRSRYSGQRFLPEAFFAAAHTFARFTCAGLNFRIRLSRPCAIGYFASGTLLRGGTRESGLATNAGSVIHSHSHERRIAPK